MECYYAIVDSARAEEMPAKLFEIEDDPLCRSLFFDTPQEELVDVAPILVKLEPGSDFFLWLLEEQRENSWGVFLTSSSTFDDVFLHLKGLMRAESAEGERFFFRFYDPRVLRAFLPSCDTEELKQMFGCIDAYLLINDDVNEVKTKLTRYINVGNELKIENSWSFKYE